MNNFDIKQLLEFKSDLYNHPNFVEDDPIQVPHFFSNKNDIEIAGFLTAIISWGLRKTIIKNAMSLIQIMDYQPFEFIMHASSNEINKCSGFIHRTFNGNDCIYFINSLRNIYKNHCGLESVFNAEIEKGNTLKESIKYFRKIFLELPHNKHVEKHIPDIEKGSAAKRLNMYLRWMIRQDDKGVDFGLWKNIPTSLLYLPLDVHTGNVARKLGILKRNQNDWKAVEEVTRILRSYDPNDPVKYDFALFGLGIYENFNGQKLFQI